MSSTDGPFRDEERAALDFHRRVLMPLRGEAARGTPALFPLRPEPAVKTYFVTRAKPQMFREDFESASGVADAESLLGALEALWRARGSAELVEIAARVAQLAEELRLEDEENGEVSPFVYAMY